VRSRPANGTAAQRGTSRGSAAQHGAAQQSAELTWLMVSFSFAKCGASGTCVIHGMRGHQLLHRPCRPGPATTDGQPLTGLRDRAEPLRASNRGGSSAACSTAACAPAARSCTHASVPMQPCPCSPSRRPRDSQDAPQPSNSCIVAMTAEGLCPCVWGWGARGGGQVGR